MLMSKLPACRGEVCIDGFIPEKVGIITKESLYPRQLVLTYTTPRITKLPQIIFPMPLGVGQNSSHPFRIPGLGEVGVSLAQVQKTQHLFPNTMKTQIYIKKRKKQIK